MLNRRINERLTLLGKSARQASLEATGKPDTIATIKRGRDPGSAKLRQVAKVLGTTTAYLLGESDDPSRPGGGDDSDEQGLRSVRRALPVLDAGRAAHWAESDAPDFVPGAKTVIPDTAVSDRAFALKLEDDSMRPQFAPGDIVIIDPAAKASPGDCVAVRFRGEAELLFRCYHQRRDNHGRTFAELKPLNAAWPTLIMDWDNPGDIIGTMVEHRRITRR